MKRAIYDECADNWQKKKRRAADEFILDGGHKCKEK